MLIVNGSNLAMNHNAHFSDREDGGGYEGGAAAHGSSGKKK